MYIFAKNCEVKSYIFQNRRFRSEKFKKYVNEKTKNYKVEENGFAINRFDVEDIENDSYLPMAGDAEKGNYVISEESIFVSEKITKGVISLSVARISLPSSYV